MTKRRQEQIDAELFTIRELRKEAYTDKQIQDRLGLSRSTFYFYIKKIRDEDKKALSEILNESISNEVLMLQDKLTMLEHQTLTKLTAEDISNRDFFDGVRLLKELGSDRIKLLLEGSEVLSIAVRQQADNTATEQTEQATT
jgi:23S rRNA pseudoU1915 N3-methylase RlmH